jgi:hypothetical protein
MFWNAILWSRLVFVPRTHVYTLAPKWRCRHEAILA